MNRVFKNIFNKTTGMYVVASEHARGTSKSSCSRNINLAIATLLCCGVSNTHAVILENNFVKVSVANDGTLGSGIVNDIGMQYDAKGEGNFTFDYLTPGTPWQMFSVFTNETGLQRNVNDDPNGEYGRDDIITTSSPSEPTGDKTKGEQATVWQGQYKDNNDKVFYTIQHEYGIDRTIHGVAVETTITAKQDLTDVKFATAIDPDPDNTIFDSVNIRGNASLGDTYTPENWIYATTEYKDQPNNMIGIYSTSNYKHNTSISNDWDFDPQRYLDGLQYDREGDFAIGMGFYIGDLKANNSAVIDYAYIFGFSNTPVIPPVDPPIEQWTNIDLRATYYQSTKLNSGRYDPSLGVNVRPIFEGGTLKVDHEPYSGFYSNNFTINNLGGRIDANGKESRYKGIFSNATGTDQSGNFYILDTTNQNGRVVFEGKNTYTGQTIIENATLALKADGNLSYSSGVHLDHAAARFEIAELKNPATQIQDLSSTKGTVFTGDKVLIAGTERDTTFAGQFTGQGGYNKVGLGTQHITGQSQEFAGITNVAQGNLRVDGLLNNRALNVLNGATLSGQGFVGGLVTGETGSFIDPNGRDFGRLTLMNDYIGQANSNILIQTVLGDDNSQTDVLAIQGDTSGTATVQVENVGGQGDDTQQGIKIIDIDGQSNAKYTLLNGPIQVNLYQYHLVQNSPQDPKDGDWYLFSTLRDGPGEYLSSLSGNVATGLSTLGSIYQRIGSPYDPDLQYKSTWARLIGNRIDRQGEKQFDYEQDNFGYQIGGEFLAIENEKSKHRFGLMNHLIKANTKNFDNSRTALGLNREIGSTDTDSFGFGGYYTASFNNNSYLDLVTQANYIENSIENNRDTTFTWEAWQAAVSAEFGRSFKLSEKTFIEPQTQVAYLYTTYRDANDGLAKIEADSNHAVVARLGAQLNHHFSYQERPFLFYGLLNYKHEFNHDYKIRLTSLTDQEVKVLSESFEPSHIEAGLGVQGQLSNLYYVYSDLRHMSDIHGDSNQTQLNIGIKGRF